MPKLIKDLTEDGLYKHPTTGVYYVRKYVVGKGEICRSLKTTDRRRAIRQKTEVLVWVGVSPKRGRIPFERVAAEVLELYTVKAEKTFLDYEGTLRLHLLPFYAKKTMDEVGPLWRIYKAHQRKLSPKRRLRHDRKHILTICRYAHERGWLDRVPSLPLDLQDKTTRPGKVITPNEFWSLYNAADEKWKIFVWFAAVLGMRFSEIRLLKKAHIDFDEGVITLPAGMIKTRKSRVVALDLKGKRLLAKWCGSHSSQWVFPMRDDESLPMTESKKTWQRIQKRSKVRVNFHSLRHTAVNWGLRLGHHEKVIEKNLGMSVGIQSRVYTHPDLESARAMGRDIGKFLEGAKK